MGKVAPGSKRVNCALRLVAGSDHSTFALTIGTIGLHSMSFTRIICDKTSAIMSSPVGFLPNCHSQPLLYNERTSGDAFLFRHCILTLALSQRSRRLQERSTTVKSVLVLLPVCCQSNGEFGFNRL